MKAVQAFITNISFPKTIDEFLYFLNHDFHFDVDDVLSKEYLEWTAPRWCKIGDVVFFMHSKTAISIITKLRTEYLNNKDKYDEKQQALIGKGIEHAIDNYKKYGGKIFAIGRVVKPTEYGDYYGNEVELHWKGKIYAPIGDLVRLEKPIDISEFNDFIYVSRQSAITGVFGKEYDDLKEIIIGKNLTSEYFTESISTPLPIKDINNQNWINISAEYRRCFFLESQFRTYYVDYLLEILTDKKVYKECICRTKNTPDCYVDNVIFVENRPALVEVKLNINNEKDLPGQMDKYCNCESIIIGGKEYARNERITEKAVVIDTNAIYLFNNIEKNIGKIAALDIFKTIDEIKNFKNNLVELIK